MTKLFATIAFICFTCLLHAQDGYVKFSADSPFRGGKVKIFQGEIVPFFKSTKADKINVIVGNDTITELSINSKSYELVSPSKLNYISQKDEFIQLRKGVGIVVNVNSIDKTDSAVVYSENKTQLTKLVNEREATIRKEDCGKSIRLVIANAPTIYYSVESLKEFAEPEPVPQAENTEAQTEEKKDTGWAWWHYALIALGACGIGFGLWKFIKRRKGNPNEEVFNSSSLKDFALKYGGVKKLSELNPNLIPPNWDKLQNTEKQRIINNLQGKRLIVRGESEMSFGFQENKNSYNDEPMTKEWDTPKETFVQSTNFGNNNELSGQLRQMENNLIREIQLGRSGNNNQNEINRLRNEKTEVENKLRTLETDKRNLDAKLMQMQSDKTTAENNLQTAMAETIRVQNEIKELEERVIRVEFLKTYSESVFSYLKYCQQVSTDAYSVFNKINQLNPEQALVPGQLLMKFQSSTISLPFGNWLQITQDIKETSATTNKSLIYGISQFNSEEERKREFQRILYTELVTKYHSSILILAESFRNLERFQVSSESVREIQKTFSDHVTTLLSKASAIGVETKYVPLFRSFEDYPGLGESVSQKVSIAFRSVHGLEKNSVAEILLYGWKIEDGEEKTQFILA